MSSQLFFTIRDISKDRSSNKTTVILELTHGMDSDEAHKSVHDLRASINAFSLLVQMLEENTPTPTPRDQKKFTQLNAHVNRITLLVNAITPVLTSSSEEGEP